MVGQLANCKKCGKLFVKTSRDLCPDCALEIDKLTIKIRDYLELFPDAKLVDVQRALNIPDKMMVILAREGKIEWK